VNRPVAADAPFTYGENWHPGKYDLRPRDVGAFAVSQSATSVLDGSDERLVAEPKIFVQHRTAGTWSPGDRHIVCNYWTTTVAQWKTFCYIGTLENNAGGTGRDVRTNWHSKN